MKKRFRLTVAMAELLPAPNFAHSDRRDAIRNHTQSEVKMSAHSPKKHVFMIIAAVAGSLMLSGPVFAGDAKVGGDTKAGYSSPANCATVAERNYLTKRITLKERCGANLPASKLSEHLGIKDRHFGPKQNLRYRGR